jgi:phage repressor protein C with HTH and peptisase S24 domain
MVSADGRADPRLAQYEQRHAHKADHQAQCAEATGPVFEPQPRNQRARQRHGGVQDGREAGGDVQHRKRVKRKRQGGVQQANEQDGAGALAKLRPDTTQQEDRHQKQRAETHTQPRRGQRTELDRAQVHEKKRGAPERGEQDEFGDECGRHGCRVCRVLRQ